MATVTETSTQRVEQVAPGVKVIHEKPIASKSARPLTETPLSISGEELKLCAHARWLFEWETNPGFRKRAAVGAKERAERGLHEFRQKKHQQIEYGHANKERLEAAEKVVRPRGLSHFSDEISIMGLSGMPVEDEGDWDELLDSKYWSRGLQQNAATFFVGKRLHIMESGNWRGTIEVTEIIPDPENVPDKHIVKVKKIA